MIDAHSGVCRIGEDKFVYVGGVVKEKLVDEDTTVNFYIFCTVFVMIAALAVFCLILKDFSPNPEGYDPIKARAEARAAAKMEILERKMRTGKKAPPVTLGKLVFGGSTVTGTTAGGGIKRTFGLTETEEKRTELTEEEAKEIMYDQKITSEEDDESDE